LAAREELNSMTNVFIRSFVDETRVRAVEEARLLYINIMIQGAEIRAAEPS
jgi:hypothetical protein